MYRFCPPWVKATKALCLYVASSRSSSTKFCLSSGPHIVRDLQGRSAQRASRCYSTRCLNNTPGHRHSSNQSQNPGQRDPKVLHGFNQSILQRLASMEDSMRVQGYSTVRIGFSILAVFGVCVYVFREYIRENVADEVSTVATMSLTDSGVQMKVHQLAMALIQTILTNDEIQNKTVLFLNDVLKNPATEGALISLLNRVLSDPSAQAKLASTLKHVLQVSLRDVNFRRELAHNLRLLLQDDSTKEGLLELLWYALGEQRLHAEAEKFVKEVLASSPVQTGASRLGKQALSDILGDENIQKKTGDALWTAFTFSVTPKLFLWETPPKSLDNQEKPDPNSGVPENEQHIPGPDNS